MKKIMGLALLVSTVSVQSAQLNQFTEMAQAISLGKKISFVVDFKNCTSSMELPPTIGALSPDAIMVIGEKRITASHRHFTLDDPQTLGDPAFDYTKFNINADGSVSLKMTILDAKTYEKRGTYSISCVLGQSFKVFAQ